MRRPMSRMTWRPAGPNMKSRLANFGGMILAGPPADFGKLIVDETEKWAKVIRTAEALHARVAIPCVK